MSGGHFEYNQYKIEEIARSVEYLIKENANGEYVDFEDEFRTIIEYLSGKSKKLTAFFYSNPKREFYVEDFEKVKLFTELKKHLSISIDQYEKIHFHKFIEPGTWNTVYKKPKKWKPYYNEKTIEQFEKGLHYLRLASVYTQRIDWLVSGDDGEKAFHERLAEELAEIEVK